LEEADDLNDFVPPVTEFRTEAYADANVSDLTKGDIIQFERKGYYICDGVIGEGVTKSLEFIHIPDGKQASLASKALPIEPIPAKGPGPVEPSKDSKAEVEILAETSMYQVHRFYGGDTVFQSEDIRMYNVKNPYC